MLNRDQTPKVVIIKLPQVSHHETFRWFFPFQEHPEAHPNVQFENVGVSNNAGYLRIVEGSFFTCMVQQRQIILWNQKSYNHASAF